MDFKIPVGRALGMRIGLVGPAEPEDIARALSIDACGLPAGMGGTPVSFTAAALARRGHEVSVFSLAPDVSRGDTVRRTEIGPVIIFQGPYRVRARERALDFFATERHAIAEMVRAHPVDALHAHWSYEFALGALQYRPDTIVTVHDWAPAILRLTPTLYRFIRLLMNDYTLKKARFFTCPSPYIAKKLSRLRGADVRVIPNFIPAKPQLIKAERKSQIVAGMNGFFGRKNGPRLLEAYARVRRSHPEVELFLLGADSEEGGGAHRWAVSRNIDEGVRFIGKIPHNELMRIFSESLFLVHPALEESFGMVLIEAMAQGTPVIGGRRSGAVPWVLGEGAVGVLCDVTSSDDIACSMLSLLRDSDERSRLAALGRARVEQLFTPDAVLPKLESFYAEVAQR